MSENKLQIRAKILSSIISLQNNTTDRSLVGNTLDELREIDDKDTVLDILHKEFLKDNTELRDYTISFLLSELIEQEKIEKLFFETLANPKINDTVKAKIVSFLRECGKHVNYEQYLQYFENPDEIIDADTVKLLESARINPEAQIDFLDFVNALPEQEKEMLVSSLSQDYDGDNLANILIPVITSNPYSNISEIAIQAIGESKSPLAYPVLKNLTEEADDPKIRAIAQKSFSLLKLSGIKEDVTSDYYKRLLSYSPVYKCFVNLPDGHGNLGIIFSRKNEMSFIQMFALVINDIDGIIDCFGFNEISEQEFDRIVNKFYQNDNVVQTDAVFCKFLMTNAEKISRLKYKELSYEYAAWSFITKDIEFREIDIEEGLNEIEMNDFLLKQLYEKDYFSKWFFDVENNEDFASLIDEIADNKIFETEKIDKIIKEKTCDIFNQSFTRIFNNRLLYSAYIVKQSGDTTYADLIFSLIDESTVKEKFKNDIIKKSVYEYFLSQKDRYESIKNATSIFTRRANKDLNDIDINYIEKCIKEIEKNWIKNA